MSAYATLTDVYRLALSASAFVTRPRALDPRASDALDPNTGIFRLIGHGLAVDDVVQMVLLGAGAVPANADANVPYYPTPLDFYRFTLAASLGGTVMFYADAGSGAWAIQIDPEVRLRAHLVQAAAEIDQDLTAHHPPLLVDPITGRYPQVIVGLNARMAARAAVTSLQIENAAFRVAIDRLMAQEKRDDEQRAAWRMGQPINPQATDQNETPDDAARATNSIVAGRVCDMGWVTGGM